MAVNSCSLHSLILECRSNVTFIIIVLTVHSYFEFNAALKYVIYKANVLLTYLLTPWSRVLLEKLTGSAASQDILCIFGTRMFLTVLTSARHLSLS